MFRGATMMGRRPLRIEYPQVTDKCLQPATIASRAYDRVGSKAHPIEEHHVGTVQAIHLSDDPRRTSLEGVDESVIHSRAATAFSVSSVWTQRSSGNTKFAQVSKRQLLHHREGEVGHLVGHVVANVYQQRLPWDAENLP